MKLSLRFRLAVMTLTIVILAAIIVGAATVTWRQVSALRGHFSSVRIESFHIAEHLQAAVLTLNATLLRFVLRRERGDWESFTRDTDQLEGWLRLQHPSTPRERQEIVQVLTDLAAYRAEANAIASRNSRDKAMLDVLSAIENASQKLLSLGYDLAGAHRAAAAQLVAAAQKSLALLQEVIFGALALLIVIGAWAIALVYREMIAPLQLKLVESRATIVRQEKLASLGVLAAGVAHGPPVHVKNGGRRKFESGRGRQRNRTRNQSARAYRAGCASVCAARRTTAGGRFRGGSAKRDPRSDEITTGKSQTSS
jgi:hypothetical protein